MPKWLRFICGIWLIGLIVACSAPRTYSGQNDGYTATLSLAQLPRANVSQDATVAITKDGQPVNATNVACELQMPGMTMGSNRPLADQNTDGTYRCGVLFTMSGEWLVVIHGNDANQSFKIVVSDITVAE